MLFPVEKLLEGRADLLCINRATTMREALGLMIKYDYSQLPVIDDQGNLTGIVSEQAILRTYYHLDEKVKLLDLSVDNCQERAVTLAPESDLFDALDRLQNDYAVVVVQDQKPVGILTDYDAMTFFRELSEGLILVEDAETTLRGQIEGVIPDDKAMLAALFIAFGADRRDPQKPAREYDELTLKEYVQLITADRNWPKFENIFQPKDLFYQLMEQVREIRNQLAHFRGRPDHIQHDILARAVRWLDTRPKVAKQQPVLVQTADIQNLEPAAEPQKGKYGPLQSWLTEQREHAGSLRISFQDIERILGQPLPSSAYEHRSWWANDSVSHPQSRAWLEAGWRVDDVDFSVKEVTFRRTVTAYFQPFFADLLEKLKAARPGITKASKITPDTFWGFSAGRTGVMLQWAFGYDTFRIELYIDSQDRDQNKAFFDALLAQKAQIEKEIGAPLEWQRIDKRRVSRISLSMPLKKPITDESLEPVKPWALATMLKFVDAFQPRIKEL